jgi:chloride channel 2
VGLITAICTFCITFFRTPEKELLKQLFSFDKLEDNKDTDWMNPNVTFNLFVFVVIKFILEAIAVSSPIPGGVFYPTFILGAGFGRLYGHILRLIIGDQINEAAYAIIGAACVVSSVTRTVSVAMIVFELNGELSYLLPVLFSVVISYAVSNNLAMSIFDVLLDMKDLPYLPALKSVDLYNQKATDIMNKNFLYLTQDSKLKDIVVLLQYLGPLSRSIPVVETEEDKILMYAVQAQSLRKYLFSHYNSISHKFDARTREKMNKYFSSLYAISHINLRRFRAKAKPNSEEEMVLKFLRTEHNLPPGQFSIDSINDMDDESRNYLSDRKQSVVRVNEFNKREIYNVEEQESTSYSATNEFWNTRIDYEHEFLEIDKSPFAVMADTPLSKVHFLFIMLNISQLFVTRRGVIIGIIAKNEFLRSNKYNHAKKKKEEEEDHEPLGAEAIPSILSQSIREVIKEEPNEDEDITYERRNSKRNGGLHKRV